MTIEELLVDRIIQAIAARWAIVGTALARFIACRPGGHAMAFLGVNTSQSERAVNALELEFPVSNIRTAVQVSLGALRSTEYADQSGLCSFLSDGLQSSPS